MWDWLKHAFAVESAAVAVPTAEQSSSIDLICREIVRRGMTLPAQMFIESSAPLHYLGGQTLRVFEPFLGVLVDPAAVRNFAAFVEQRGAVEYICQRLEELQRQRGDRVVAPQFNQSNAPSGDVPS